MSMKLSISKCHLLVNVGELIGLVPGKSLSILIGKHIFLFPVLDFRSEWIISIAVLSEI